MSEDDVSELSNYEYRDGERWVVNNAAVAAPSSGMPPFHDLFGFVVDCANDPNVSGGYLGGLFGTQTGGNISEMSVQNNDYLNRDVVRYADGNNNVRLRVADEPEGPWSDPINAATSAEYPGTDDPPLVGHRRAEEQSTSAKHPPKSCPGGGGITRGRRWSIIRRPPRLDSGPAGARGG